MLNHDGKRTMNVKALTTVNVFILDKPLFFQLLKFTERFLKKDYNREFENILQQEEMLSNLKKQQELYEKKEQELQKRQEEFNKQKQEE